MSSDISLETSFQDVPNDMSHDRIGQELNEIFQTIEFTKMLSEQNYDDLRIRGYTVVKDVLTSDECDDAIGQYRQWLAQFKDGDWPDTAHSLIFKYNTGHMAPTWAVRLKTKNVFAQLWKTDKLLTSFDAIAIGRPPEEGTEAFQNGDNHWLHVDQSAYKVGLHAYQGAVYLEEACEDDWTFHVVEMSHSHFPKFFLNNPVGRKKSDANDFYRLTQENIEILRENYCQTKRVAVPKGGMVLWDSRIVHANARPLEGRSHPGRWRFCVFVSMTPAIWASKKDIREKQKAYKSVTNTTHWSSERIKHNVFEAEKLPVSHQHISFPTTLPDIAKTKEARLLAGKDSYDFHDGAPTGIELKPKWNFCDS